MPVHNPKISARINRCDVLCGDIDAKDCEIPCRSSWPKWLLKVDGEKLAAASLTSRLAKQGSFKKDDKKLDALSFSKEHHGKKAVRIGVPGGTQVDFKAFGSVILRWYGSSFRAAHNSNMYVLGAWMMPAPLYPR